MWARARRLHRPLLCYTHAGRGQAAAQAGRQRTPCRGRDGCIGSGVQHTCGQDLEPDDCMTPLMTCTHAAGTGGWICQLLRGTQFAYALSNCCLVPAWVVKFVVKFVVGCCIGASATSVRILLCGVCLHWGPTEPNFRLGVPGKCEGYGMSHTVLWITVLLCLHA
jgi:hypothetical protein